MDFLHSIYRVASNKSPGQIRYHFSADRNDIAACSIALSPQNNHVTTGGYSKARLRDGTPSRNLARARPLELVKEGGFGHDCGQTSPDADYNYILKKPSWLL